MKIGRASLLAGLGATAVAITWLGYVGLLLLRYGRDPIALDGPVWVAFVAVPAMIGGVAALLLPGWQRLIKIRSSALAAVLLFLLLALTFVMAQFLILDFHQAVVKVTSLDLIMWLLCAVAAGLIFHLLRLLTGDTRRAMATVVGGLRRTLGFKPDRTQRVTGIALVFDLQGFAAFFNQPWAKSHVPRYLDLVFSSITIELFGGTRFWGDKSNVGSFTRPVHQKFLGDGMLYVWTPGDASNRFRDSFVSELMARLCSFCEQFPLINEACKGPIPYSFELPPQVRFGVARGQIYELARRDSTEKEYMGFCINLASRLQGYCRELGLAASASMKIPEETMEKLGLVTVVAKKIKGFENEEIIVIADQFERLSDNRIVELFLTEDEL